MTRPEFIHLDQCNFEDFPPGGTLSFAKHMRRTFGERIALAGMVTDGTPCGKWVEKDFDGLTFPFFGIGRLEKKASKPLVPARMSSYLAVKRHMPGLQRLGIRKIFSQTPQFMLALKRSDWDSICFYFAGMGNSVSLSRYPYLRWLGSIYEQRLFKALSNNADCILAAADSEAINATIKRSKGILEPGSIKRFPTRFDENVFYPRDRDECRCFLGLPLERAIIAVNGKLSWIKGWSFVIQTLRRYLSSDPNAMLIFIGDGEDREKIESENSDLIMGGSVKITGRICPDYVSRFLGASNVVFVGSYEEGWSTAMVEALACGKPIVTTNISGARDMVIPGQNGFILHDRNPHAAAQTISRALKLHNAGKISLALSAKFSIRSMAADLESLWLH